MKSYSLITPTVTLFCQALRADQPLDKPLTLAEKWVLRVLMKCRQGEEPDTITRENILWISRTNPNQWARITETSPELAEIMAAVNNFFFGNLIERCVKKSDKA
jgi:hypothetical protein